MKTTIKSTISRRTPTRRSLSVDSEPQVRAGASGTSLLTLGEAAIHFGHVHRTTIMRWVREGRLRCIRLSRKAILFEPAELDRFVREHRFSG